MVNSCQICGKPVDDDIGIVHNCEPIGISLCDAVAKSREIELNLKRKPIALKWESAGPTATRSKVFGGWIVRIFAAEKNCGGPVFIPDPNWYWEIE